MLRRLDLKDPWRCLDRGFWPEDLPSGGRTVLYGHNGSGKSTLSELLLSLAEGDCATDVLWEDEQQRRIKVGAGGVSPSASMAVFTRKWVEDNLSAFLDGADASAIVTLGKEAIDAKEEEDRLVEEISKLREDAKDAGRQAKSAGEKVDKLARTVQDRIVSELKEFDYSHFTKNRYAVPKVQDDLRKYKGEFPDSNAHAESLKRLGEGAPSPVQHVIAPPVGVASLLNSLVDILADTPSRVAIKAIEGQPSAQAWVERGLVLHADLDHCLFCSGKISGDRRDQLARHFDESWLQIRSKAKELLTAVTSEKQQLAAGMLLCPPRRAWRTNCNRSTRTP